MMRLTQVTFMFSLRLFLLALTLRTAPSSSSPSQLPAPPLPTPIISVLSTTPCIFRSVSEHAHSCACGVQEFKLHEIKVQEAFDPRSLAASSRRLLQKTEILITEPAILAKLLEEDNRNPSPSPSSLLLPKLKWCQLTFAGVDALFATNSNLGKQKQKRKHKKDVLEKILLTRLAGNFGQPIAEWCLGNIIAHERNFDLMRKYQSEKHWGGGNINGNNAPSGSSLRQYRHLSDLTLVILGGCGDIGKCISKSAKFGFGMRTIAYTKPRRLKHEESSEVLVPIPVPDGIDECTHDLDYALQEADYLVSVLPSTPDTNDMLSQGVLARAAVDNGGKCPIFLNCGRGNIIDDESLLSALDRGYISGAILDVFREEPLPKDSPLWERSDVTISPHISGVTRGEDVPDLFWRNYRRYVNGEPLLYEVDWEKGY